MTEFPSKLRQTVFSASASKDIAAVLAWSLDRFGIQAAARYELLLLQAFHDLAADPARPGSRNRPEIAEGTRTYHISMSGKRVSGGKVKKPRHFILYRASGTTLNIARILHDRVDLVHGALDL